MIPVAHYKRSEKEEHIMKRFLATILSAMIATTAIISTNVSAATTDNNQKASNNCIEIASQLKNELRISQDDIDTARAIEVRNNYPVAAFECDEDHRHYAFDAEGQYIVHDIVNGYTLVQTNIRDLLYADDEFRAIRFDGRKFIAHDYVDCTDIAYVPSNGDEAPTWTISTCGYFAEITHNDGYFYIRANCPDENCDIVDHISEEELGMNAEWFTTNPLPEKFCNSSEYIFIEDVANYNTFFTSLGDLAITARLRDMQKAIEKAVEGAATPESHEPKIGDIDPSGNYIWTGNDWLDIHPITTCTTTATTTTTTTTLAPWLTELTTTTTATASGFRYVQFGENVIQCQNFELTFTNNGYDILIPDKNVSAHADNVSEIIRIMKS